MRQSGITLVILFVLLGPVSGQPDERTESILVNEPLITRGFVVYRDREINASDEGPPTWVRRVGWRSPSLDGLDYEALEAELFYSYFEGSSRAVDAFEDVSDLFRAAFPIQHEEGVDGIRAFGDRGIFIKDHFVVAYVVRGRALGSGTDDSTPLFGLASELKEALIQKIDAANQPKIPPFVVEFQRDQSSSNIVVSADFTGGIAPFYRWDLGQNTPDGYEVALEQRATFHPEGSGNIVITPDTSALSPGSYQLNFVVGDRLNRGDVYSTEFVVGQSGASVTLLSSQDSTLRAKKPHRNEGANPRLFLSHRLESRGKSQNPIVGFDLSNEDLTGLSKATLVLNVQDCEVPRRWGNDGRFIIACPVNEPWVEGNGNKYRVQGGAGKTKGQGQGVTWFSPVDEKIQNNRPNGSVQWDGARSVTGQPTAPPVLLTNGQTGNVEFDVTQDVLAGFQDGWVIKKQDETKFGNIRFYSKEGAGGDAELTPRLILEFGSSTAQTNEAPADGVLAKLGFGSAKLESKPNGSELPSIREQLQNNPVAAYAGETLLGAMVGPNPALKMASQAAYRTWLA